MGNLVDELKFVPILHSANYGTSGVNSTSINMKNYHHATLVFTFGAITGDSTLTIKSAAAADTGTTAISDWTGWMTGADIGAAASDTFSATAVAVDSGEDYATLTAATYDNRMVVIEIPASKLAAGHSWIRVEIDGTATAGIVHCVAVLQPRYKQKDIPTAVKTA